MLMTYGPDDVCHRRRQVAVPWWLWWHIGIKMGDSRAIADAHYAADTTRGRAFTPAAIPVGLTAAANNGVLS